MRIIDRNGNRLAQPITINGISKITVQFEEGDTFVDEDNGYFVIVDIDSESGEIVFATTAYDPLLFPLEHPSWQDRFRYAGNIDTDSEIEKWDSALDISGYECK